MAEAKSCKVSWKCDGCKKYHEIEQNDLDQLHDTLKEFKKHEEKFGRRDWDNYNNKTQAEQKEVMFDCMYEMLSTKEHLKCYKWKKYSFKRIHSLPPVSIALIESLFK